MSSLIRSMHNQVSLVNQCVGEIGTTLQDGVSKKIQKSKTSMSHSFHSVSQGCQETARYAGRQFINTIDKIESILYQHKKTLLFIGCCTITASTAPLLFFPVVLASAALRIEATRKLNETADNYLKDEHNPYKYDSQFKCIKSLGLAISTVAALDSLAMGTLFLTIPLATVLLPVAAGMAAGNALATWGMNRANYLASEPRSENRDRI